MGDDFLRALAAELAQTQRALVPNCLFCVPQPRSLLTDEALSQDVLYSHLLTPNGVTDDEPHRRLGAYSTLNGKRVTIVGSHIRTGEGFSDSRQVRILLSERRDVQHQHVTVLHISRPLEGGIQVPDDLNEMDMATFRKYTAMLRSFPENELVFYHLNETINQVHKICAREHVYIERYQETLPDNLREEWDAAVDELIRAGSFDEDQDEDTHRQPSRFQGRASHLLQLQQVVECYLMERLHDLIFPRVITSCRELDAKLHFVMSRMRHYTPQDFGIRNEFQCFVAEARDTLLTVVEKKTPLDMLLVLKTCMDQISDAITRNVKLRRLDFETCQITTDDILDQLLVVLLQACTHISRTSTKCKADPVSRFPMVAVMRYMSDYHFINSNTTALGFTMANFQVAVEYFLMRGEHQNDDCPDSTLQDAGTEVCCSQVITESNCIQAARKIHQDLRKSEERVARARRETGAETRQDGHDISGSATTTTSRDVVAPISMKCLSIIGEWSSSTSDQPGDKDETSSSGPLAVHPVHFGCSRSQDPTASDTNVLHVSGGQRFFATVLEDGKLWTWGDSSGGRLGYALAHGTSRRVCRPQLVLALKQQTIMQVACGAFHALATDLNGHVFAWGSNSRGQLGFLSSTTLSTVVETPSIVEELRGTYMSSVACGEYHSLALSSDGCVFSWGCNKYGKLGRTAEGLLGMVQPGLLETDWTGWSLDTKSRIGRKERSVVIHIAAGKDHSLAITSDGVGFTWGRGDAGQLGHGCYMDVSRPMQVMAISVAITDTSGLVDVAGGNDFSLFLLRNGTVYISGRDPSLDADEPLLSPTLLSLPSHLERDFFGRVVQVSCGGTHYALLTTGGALLLSHTNSSQPSPNAGSTTAEVHERRVTWVKDAGIVGQMDCGASHTLVVG
uniref:VPS9 domain-containing protein n=1 Tax=Peronospora matthiolae TaxID=2874970 RepID=A0AAV1TKA4_9STRA